VILVRGKVDFKIMGKTLVTGLTFVATTDRIGEVSLERPDGTVLYHTRVIPQPAPALWDYVEFFKPISGECILRCTDAKGKVLAGEL
jgi:hypothetical protein